jgi:hypothetical protein
MKRFREGESGVAFLDPTRHSLSDIEFSKIPGAQRATPEYTTLRPKIAVLQGKKRRGVSGFSGGSVGYDSPSRWVFPVHAGTGRCDPAGAWQAGSAAPTAPGPLRRPRLRFGPASPPLAAARHSTPDRPAGDVARQRIGEISLVRGADVVVAARFRKTARPQGSNSGYPSGVSQTCLCDNLS